ncbi:MAG TPA: type II secretion system protein [Candidatus Microsaccharimonas sp.]
MSRVGNIIKRKQRKGFTIVELLIVIVVIGILAAIVIVGYGAVVNNANDTSVKADLQKMDDTFKQFALDNDGVFPASVADLTTLSSIKLNPNSYATTNSANIYLCTNSTSGEYALIAMSKSGNRFVVKSERGISQYKGNIVWNATTSNYATTCADIDPTYTSPAGNPAGMIGSAFLPWTGVTTQQQYITNTITNPSLESNTLTGITAYYSAPLSVDTTKAAFGTSSLKIVTNNANAATPQGGIFSGDNSAVPGATYTCSVSVFGPTGKSFTIDGRIFNSSGAYLTEGLGRNTFVMNATWQRVSMSFTAPASTGSIALEGRMIGADMASGLTIWMDGAMCAQTSLSYNYADGASTGWNWSGAAKLSTSSGPGL